MPLPLPFDQSKSTMPQPSVVLGSVNPVLLHGMMIVDCHGGGGAGRGGRL